MLPRSEDISAPDLREDLCGQGYELIETHISRVFLDHENAFKLKKPVNLGFLDFTTMDRRHKACLAELELNRRLAPDVYHGVVPVVRDRGGVHRFGSEDAPGAAVVDWAVRMRRLPDAWSAEQRLMNEEEGAGLEPHDLASLAALLARFHTDAAQNDETSRHGTVEAIRANVRENFEQTRESLTEYLSANEAREIEHWQLGFLDQHAALFEARVRNGRIRDGHGDLRLEHAYLDERGRWSVIDCIEFNQRFRYADVCADIAFMAMDLSWHDRCDLAERFVADYAREANDYDLYPLLDFYQSYRAFVRGKVSSILVNDASAPHSARQRARLSARRYYLLALAAAHRPLTRPVLVAVGGWIATGKSTLARRAAELLDAPLVEADRTRKYLAGVAPQQPLNETAFRGAYSPEFSERVYAEIHRRADSVLSSGRPVVIDATYRTREYRAQARRLAEEHHVPFVFVECMADRAQCLSRLRERARGPCVSDGREEIFDDFVRQWEPTTEMPHVLHERIDTGHHPSATEQRLRARLAPWLPMPAQNVELRTAGTPPNT